MIDIGISKLALIGAVALVVIGPEKLPRVARTAVPRWYKARSGLRTHVQSGAARVARFRPKR